MKPTGFALSELGRCRMKSRVNLRTALVIVISITGVAVVGQQERNIFKSSWGMGGYGYHRTANRDYYRVPGGAGSSGAVAWSFQLSSAADINTGVVCTPVTNYKPEDGTVDPTPTIYFGADDGKLYAYTLDWANSTPSSRAVLKWSFQVTEDSIDFPIRSTPTLVYFKNPAEGQNSWGICFGADNGRVYCLRDDGSGATLMWRWSRVGAKVSNTYPIIRSSPLFRPSLAQTQPEPPYPQLVFVGAVGADGGGVLAGFDVDFDGSGGDNSPASGYNITTIGAGIAASVSYVADWQEVNNVWYFERGYLVVPDLGNVIHCIFDNLSGFQDHQTRANAYEPTAPITGWAAIREEGGISEVTAYVGTAAHNDSNYGGFIYAATAQLTWSQGTSTLSWRWSGLPHKRIETTPYRPPGLPPPPIQDLNLGFIYADPCIDTAGEAIFGTWLAGAEAPSGGSAFGMFTHVSDAGTTATAPLDFKNTTSPKDYRATPCVGRRYTGGSDAIFFVTAGGSLTAGTTGGAIAYPFPISLGYDVGDANDAYGARPMIVVDGEGLIYIGGHGGHMKAVWAPH